MDQVHDRGFYRTLGNFNHLRQVLLRREYGKARACSQRIVRSLVQPKDWKPQFDRILEIESALGWRSTFFILEGYNWSRHGSRYRLEDQRIQSMASMIKDAGCEIGVHGSCRDINKPEKYRLSADRIEAAFGVRPVGIRNHYLRFSFPDTWKAQADAGFFYDATFGWKDQVGFREGRRYPFEPSDPESGEPINIVVLPLTIQDVSLFEVLRLKGREAILQMESILKDAATSGGLVSVLWHNNYFDEGEYAEREEVYAEFLRRAVGYHPFCATGAEIARWWKAQQVIEWGQ